ncbi:hypothetical protein E0198_000088 [Clavispora lusitaniae]|nr:hypothetical protein E0198_000088 [Clavispora lusitaniae]
MQFHYMAPWIPCFTSAIEGELAAKDHKPPFTSFQFASVDTDGFPHNRTVVFRGFLFDNKSNNVLTFCTDKRMGKYEELLHNDKFEAVFYFEKVKKQFRFRGRAKIIDDNHSPNLDLTVIQPKHIIASSMNSEDSSDEDEDSESELRITVASSRSSASPSEDHDVSPQQRPIHFPIISPSLLSNIQQENSAISFSYPNLHELSGIDFKPPTKEEWDGEIARVWNSLSKGLKSSFRRPAPMSPVTDENHNLMDKISRGVDGKKEESGMKNFAVVAMFIDQVDYYEMEKERRYIYVKDDTHLWSEQEVCP